MKNREKFFFFFSIHAVLPSKTKSGEQSSALHLPVLSEPLHSSVSTENTQQRRRHGDNHLENNLPRLLVHGLSQFKD